jgi:hypothetical protein
VRPLPHREQPLEDDGLAIFDGLDGLPTFGDRELPRDLPVLIRPAGAQYGDLGATGGAVLSLEPPLDFDDEARERVARVVGGLLDRGAIDRARLGIREARRALFRVDLDSVGANLAP